MHRIRGMMEPDPYAPDGGYEIRSIYFDDPYDTCLREVAAGVDLRVKYRIRSYDTSDSVIRLEKKSKKNGMTKKEQALLTKDLYEDFLNGDFDIGKALAGGKAGLINEFTSIAGLRCFSPKVIVCYYRTPFVKEEGNVRVTFDDGIASASDFSSFFDRDLMKRPVMPVGQTLMEVKYDAFFPAYLHEALDIGRLQQISFSKYDICRRYGI